MGLFDQNELARENTFALHHSLHSQSARRRLLGHGEQKILNTARYSGVCSKNTKSD